MPRRELFNLPVRNSGEQIAGKRCRRDRRSEIGENLSPWQLYQAARRPRDGYNRTRVRSDPSRLAREAWRVNNARLARCVQRNTCVAAPEVQQKKLGSSSCDMYSLGMTICAIYNQGRPLIQANHSSSDYLKQLETVSQFIYTHTYTYHEGTWRVNMDDLYKGI